MVHLVSCFIGGLNSIFEFHFVTLCGAKPVTQVLLIHANAWEKRERATQSNAESYSIDLNFIPPVD